MNPSDDFTAFTDGGRMSAPTGPRPMTQAQAMALDALLLLDKARLILADLHDLHDLHEARARRSAKPRNPQGTNQKPRPMTNTFRKYCKLCGFVHGTTSAIGVASVDCPVTKEGYLRCSYCGRPEPTHPQGGHAFTPWPDDVLPIQSRGLFGKEHR